MDEYKHILVAVDLTEESRPVAAKACVLQKAYSASLSCVHVIEPLSLAYGGDIPMDLSTIQEQIQETAKAHLTEFASRLDIPIDNHSFPDNRRFFLVVPHLLLVFQLAKIKMKDRIF